MLSIHSDHGVEEGYQVFGGIFREECVMLLRRFYVQDNGKVPVVKVSFSLSPFPCFLPRFFLFFFSLDLVGFVFDLEFVVVANLVGF